MVERTPELLELMTEVHATIDAVLDLRPGVPQEIRNFVRSIDDPSHLADNTGYSPDYTFAERQELLETFDVAERLRKVRDFYRNQLALLQVQAKLRQEVQDSANKQQREFYLRQQMQAIRKELGEAGDEDAELDDLRAKLAEAALPEAARKEADREMSRLARMNNASPEHQMVRTYLEWLAELPWGKTTGSEIDVAYARQVLDQDHYGLEKIKERLLEYLAVKKRREELNDEADDRSREPILAFVGPPGVGKTSLGQSIARALGRSFVRMSLGGVRDEAELRGFRRTYIGSQPGRLIQELRRAGDIRPGDPARRDRQAGQRLSRRPGLGAARGARPRAEPHVHRSLPERALRPVQGAVYRDGQHLGHRAAGPARPYGSDRAERLHRGREGADRPAAPAAEAGARQRPAAQRGAGRGAGAALDRRRLHPRGRRAQPGAPDRQRAAQGHAADRRDARGSVVRRPLRGRAAGN